MLSTLTWISDKDIFNELLGVPSYLIETPIMINDVLIEQYSRTPLYKGLIKHVVTVQGSDDTDIGGVNAIEEFNKLIQNNFYVMTYTTPLIRVEEILGVTRQLQIALYNKGYKTKIIYYINGNEMTFVLMIKDENLYVDHDIVINVEAFIGYKPLVDLYVDPVEVYIAASELIFQCDLTPFDYIVINGIPVVKVGGQTEQEVFAIRAEFGMDKLLPIVSKIINLYNNNINNNLLTIEAIKEALTNLSVNHKMVYLKYAAIRAYMDLYKNDQYKDIKVSSNLMLSVPSSVTDMEEYRKKVNDYMNVKKTDYFVQVYKTQKEAANDRALMTLDNNGIYLTIPLNNDYYVVGNLTPKMINYEMIYDTLEDGVYDATINKQEVLGLTSKKPKVPQV